MTFLQILDYVRALGIPALFVWIGRSVTSYYNVKKKRETDTLEMLKNNYKRLDERDKLLQDAIMVIHHDLLYQNCNRYIVRGYITIAERDNLGYMFKAYKSLGGNGTGESIYNRAMGLPLKIE